MIEKNRSGKKVETIYGQHSGQTTLDDVKSAEEVLGRNYQYAKDNGLVGLTYDPEEIEDSTKDWRLEENVQTDFFQNETHFVEHSERLAAAKMVSEAPANAAKRTSAWNLIEFP